MTRTHGAARPGAVRRRRARPRRPPARAADRRHRRGAEQPAGSRGREPVQLLARPADLDPRRRAAAPTSGCAASRSCWTASPRRCPTGRASSPTSTSPTWTRAEVLRGASSSLYGNASGGVIALAERARGTGTLRPADPGPGRQRRARRRRLLQVAELELGAERARERDALGVASSRPMASASTAPARSASSTPVSTTSSAATTIGTLRLSAGRQPARRRIRAPSPAPSTSPTRTRPPPTTSVAPPTRTCSSSSSRSGLKHIDAAGQRVRRSRVFGLLRDLENPLAAPPPASDPAPRSAPSSPSTAPSAASACPAPAGSGNGAPSRRG